LRYFKSNECRGQTSDITTLPQPLRTESDSDLYAPTFEEVEPFDESLRLPLEAFSQIKYPLTADDLTRWYIWRSRDIETKTGLVENSTALIELAINQSIPGLIEYYRTLVGLYTLVYQCGKDLTLVEYEALPDYDRFCLLVDDANGNNIAEFLTTRAQTVLEKEAQLWSEGKFTSSGTFGSDWLIGIISLNCRTDGSILARWMLDQSAKGRLSQVAGVIKASKPSSPTRIISNNEALLAIALECVYSFKEISAQTWPLMSEIYQVRGSPSLTCA